MSQQQDEPDFREHLGTEIVNAFRQGGLDLTAQHQLRFLFVAEAEAAGRDLAAALEAEGFTCELEQLEDGGWLCMATRSMSLDVEALNALGLHFLALGSERGAEFGGWERVPTLAEILAAGGGLTVGKINPGEVDLERYPHAVFVRIPEPIEPIARGERYEDPLAAALEERGVGIVTGGGSQLGREARIEFVRLDLQLADLNGSLSLVREAMEELGAPIGSMLEFETAGRSESIRFGTQQELAIYLDGASLPDRVYEATDVGVLTGLLNGALAPTSAGEVRHEWHGSTESGLFIYGPSAERMFEAVEPVLLTYPLGQNSRVVIRSDADVEPREVRIPRRD